MSRPSHTLPAPLDAAPVPEVINHTPWPSQYFQHIDPQGEVFHVMVCRLTYSLSQFDCGQGELPVPLLLAPEAQAPLCTADRFTGEANASSVIEESDFAPYKPKCDVLLVNAIAYPPGGKPMRRWPVGFRLGDAITKTLQVTGPRRMGLLGPSEPEAIDQVPIRYELAFGGPNLIAQSLALDAYANPPTRNAQPDRLIEARAEVAREVGAKLPPFYTPNPIGCGRQGKAIMEANVALAKIEGAVLTAEQQRALEGIARSTPKPAPQIEAFDRSYQGQEDGYPVVGLGPVGRWWQPRVALAGTHDAHWKRTQWPKSPLDHDYRYWNCAPEDQQIDYPQGGEDFALVNLTPRAAPDGGPVRFALPTQDLQLLVRLNVGVLMFAPMHIDTVIVDFHAGTLTIVRRATLSARTDVRQLELGAWPAGTAMELDDELRELAKGKQGAAKPAKPPMGAPRG